MRVIATSVLSEVDAALAMTPSGYVLWIKRGVIASPVIQLLDGLLRHIQVGVSDGESRTPAVR
jgi:hypothetical protein